MHFQLVHRHGADAASAVCLCGWPAQIVRHRSVRADRAGTSGDAQRRLVALLVRQSLHEIVGKFRNRPELVSQFRCDGALLEDKRRDSNGRVSLGRSSTRCAIADRAWPVPWRSQLRPCVAEEAAAPAETVAGQTWPALLVSDLRLSIQPGAERIPWLTAMVGGIKPMAYRVAAETRTRCRQVLYRLGRFPMRVRSCSLTASRTMPPAPSPRTDHPRAVGARHSSPSGSALPRSCRRT